MRRNYEALLFPGRETRANYDTLEELQACASLYFGQVTLQRLAHESANRSRHYVAVSLP